MKAKVACSVVGVLAIAMILGSALAQRPAGSKITGNAYNFYSGSMHTRHARDHARVLRAYSTTRSELPPEAVKHHTAQVQQNVATAKSALAKAKPLAKDKESQQLVKSLETHYAACDEHCKKLMAGGMDDQAMADCCSDLAKTLEAAAADHDKLMKKLGIEPLEPATDGEKQ